jgi:DUF1365 family protein
MNSAIYEGIVMHHRLRPKQHTLRYRVFSLLLDLDELPSLRLPLLGINRPGLLSFHDRDHGDGVTPLKQWATTQLHDAGVAYDGGRITLLCYPRMFGFVFNPLSVWFCHNRDGALAGILYEVHNTHGERHTYVLPAPPRLDQPGEARLGQSRTEPRIVRHSTRKEFFVSPFMPPECAYNFRIAPPGRRVGVSILEHDAEGLLLTASFTGERHALTNRALASLLVRYPLMTVKVVAAIHWEAVKLLLKGFRIFHHRKAAHRIAVSAPRAAAVEPAE